MQTPRLLLTRPEPRSREFLELIDARFGQDFDAVISPVLRVVPLPFKEDPKMFDGLVFTSQSGVEAFANAGSIEAHSPITAWCVGDRTAAAALRAGLKAHSAAGALQDLARLLTTEAPGARLLQLSGRQVAGDLSALIGPGGPDISRAVIYEQYTQPLNAAAKLLLQGQSPVLLPVFSPRSASFLSQQLQEAHAPLAIAAMSPAVAKNLAVQDRHRVEVATQPDALAMLQTLEVLLEKVMSA
ncbi:MAG: uroporphyrinogen-III synthase [Pseudomonadota bacterium]